MIAVAKAELLRQAALAALVRNSGALLLDVRGELGVGGAHLRSQFSEETRWLFHFLRSKKNCPTCARDGVPSRNYEPPPGRLWLAGSSAARDGRHALTPNARGASRRRRERRFQDLARRSMVVAATPT